VKKLLISVLLLVLLTGCGSSKIIDGVEYDTIGLISQEADRDPNIKYEVIWGNVIWGVVLIETILAPIYFFGFSLWEPRGNKNEVIGKTNI
jgi:hypothetical protein